MGEDGESLDFLSLYFFICVMDALCLASLFPGIAVRIRKDNVGVSPLHTVKQLMEGSRSSLSYPFSTWYPAALE
jgi:hypothetical protein